ncbi:MAG: TetR/AcrR family transcriptional regulator [Lachnospiraceae bacterium]|nr:TetR/AcrR family transcriptional regulator [Lachnospiraceae bacterium]
MRDPEKVKKEMEERDGLILDTAFDIFVVKKIEAVSMDEIAEAAGVGRATVFRYYKNKRDLAISVCSRKWKQYLDELDRVRPISSIGNISALDRLIFTMDQYIDMYQNHKDLLIYNDNFNHFVRLEGKEDDKLVEFHQSLWSADTRFHMMYEKAKEDHSFRTDIPEDEFMHVTVQTMMAACTHYAGGFIWGSEENKDYTKELLLLKDMILSYVRI